MRKFYIGTLLTFAFSLLTSPIHAQSSLDSQNYRVRLGNFNMTSGSKSSTHYQLTDTVGQIAAEFFYNNNYHVKAGFQYIYTLFDFSFSLSSLAVDLNPLVVDTFSNANHDLIVSAPGQGYSVTTYEIHRLKNQNGDFIDDTICDSGPCTTSTAQLWNTPTNSGFGYNVTGDDHDPAFTSDSHFRPFPDLSLGGTPATVMISTTAGKNRLATVNYRLAVDGSQASGNYSTEIVYIATPVY